MESCDNHAHKPLSLLRKLMPTLILAAVAVLAGGTDVFSHEVHLLVGNELKQLLSGLTPYLFNTLFAAIWMNIGWLLYHRCACGFDRLLTVAKMEAGPAKLVGKGFRLLYWLVVSFCAIAFFAPSLIGWMAGGATLVTAALSVNFGGLLNDWVCGWFLQRWLKEGEYSKVSEITMACGKVTSIGSVRTIIESEVDGPVSVRNSKLWDCTIAKPKPTLIILSGDKPKADGPSVAAKT